MTKAGTWPQADTSLDIQNQLMGIICRKLSKSKRKTRGSPVLLPCGTLLSEAGVSEHILNSFSPSGHLSSKSDVPGNTDVRQGPDLRPPGATSTPTPCQTVTTTDVSRHGLMSPGSQRKGGEQGQAVLADQHSPRAAAPTGMWTQLIPREPDLAPGDGTRGCVSSKAPMLRRGCSQPH